MDIREAIMTRRSTRVYKDKAVDQNIVKEIIEAGRLALCGGNSQKTHFIVIRNKDILNQLAVLVQKEYAAMEVTPGMYQSKASMIKLSKMGTYTFHCRAPVVIVLANERGYTNALADSMVGRKICCSRSMYLI